MAIARSAGVDKERLKEVEVAATIIRDFSQKLGGVQETRSKEKYEELRYDIERSLERLPDDIDWHLFARYLSLILGGTRG